MFRPNGLPQRRLAEALDAKSAIFVAREEESTKRASQTSITLLLLQLPVSKSGPFIGCLTCPHGREKCPVAKSHVLSVIVFVAACRIKVFGFSSDMQAFTSWSFI